MSGQFVKVTLKPAGQGQFALVALRRDPVNSLNTAVWKQLLSTLDQLESSPQVRGVIFFSNLEKDVFTAGNDLMELYAPKTSLEKYETFWVTATTFLARLYRSRLVTIAAIRGACPAGGCCLALCCDYRIWTEDTPDARIGLNETAIGIPVPRFWAKLLAEVIGSKRVSDQMLLFGQTISPQEALQVGLVHELVSKTDLMARAQERMVERLMIPDGGRILTKMVLREQFSKEWEAFAKEEAAYGWKALSDPGTVKFLTQVLKRLSSKL